MRSPLFIRGKMIKDTIQQFFKNQFDEHIRVAEKTSESIYPAFKEIVEICSDALKGGKKILFFGNGGSASDSQHLATELTVRFSQNRAAISAIALTTDTSTLTAIGNDFGFKYLFSRQVEAIGNSGDVSIGITTSGKSENILLGIKKSKEMGLKTIAFTGKNKINLDILCDAIISIPANNTSRIQEMHITVGQMLCNALEHNLGLSELVKEEKV